MIVSIGIDVGTVSAKLACVGSQALFATLSERGPLQLRRLDAGDHADSVVYVAAPRRTRGQPQAVVLELLDELAHSLPPETACHITCTGSGSALLAHNLGAETCNEFQAATRGVSRLHAAARTIFEIGGENSRYIRCEPDPSSGQLGIVDYGSNGDCAAGTGTFLDQQAGRLQIEVEQIAAAVGEAERAAQIAGRCSVFAKSDMIHAQQKGFVPQEVLRGLCNAVVRNFKAAVVKGRPLIAPIALIGGVAANDAVVNSLRELFELSETDLSVPNGFVAISAVGAAMLATESNAVTRPLKQRIARLRLAAGGNGYAFPATLPLSMAGVTLLRDRERPFKFSANQPQIDAYLGLDIGSVGTKLVLIDEHGDVITSIFTRTQGRPIEVVSRALREIEEAVGWGVRIRGVGTTGSGRELIGELVGADTINDEITAHKTGAVFVGDRLLGRRPDTIFEIGGQDSKYISLQSELGENGNGRQTTIVVDFTMNEACAAGTGSFLEERAEELGVSIKGQFAELALQSQAPLRLGERCTVFMERDVNTYLQRGAKRDDIIAGLAYSVAHNYINRVVRGRPIGECVFFQGGTAYNDAVAAAFSMITGKQIIVPPHNAVLGAIGAALLAKEKIEASGGDTRFRGYDIGQIDYSLREFTCHGCGNECSIQEFTVEQQKTFWGDKCSDRFRKQRKSEHEPIIPDLVALRHELLHAAEDKPAAAGAKTIGIPLAMYTLDLLPLWRTFFVECGLKVELSQETNRQTVQFGTDATVAEPCFPIIVSHGHVVDLVKRGVDCIWLPNLISTDLDHEEGNNFLCPWGQTLPFVARASAPIRQWPGQILCPTMRLDRGREVFKKTMLRVARDLGIGRKIATTAFDRAMEAQHRFRTQYQQAGRAALDELTRTGEPGIILVGRPYNIHDAGVSLSVARKLREHYGVNLLPVDALPLNDVAIEDVNDNMYWTYGQRILAAAKLAGQHTNLHIIYVTNFKCGPDSFIKGFIRPASDKPFLTLQFDGHSNDAGMMTRCEAYLDSKGILRWWKAPQSKPADQVSPAGDSTSPKCATPLRG